VDDVDDVNGASAADDIEGGTDQQGDPSMTTPEAAGAPDVQGTDTTPEEEEKAASQRLAEIARRKREILSRVYQPGNEPQQAPAAPGPSMPGVQASEGTPSSVLRNREDWYNKYEQCQGVN